MTREIRKPKPKFRPAPLRQARSAARGNPKPETRSSKLDPWRSGTGSEATAPESRNRNGRGEPRNTRNTRKEGGETLSFLFRVFSGSVLVENPRSLQAIWTIGVQRAAEHDKSQPGALGQARPTRHDRSRREVTVQV